MHSSHHVDVMVALFDGDFVGSKEPCDGDFTSLRKDSVEPVGVF